MKPEWSGIQNLYHRRYHRKNVQMCCSSKSIPSALPIQIVISDEHGIFSQAYVDALKSYVLSIIQSSWWQVPTLFRIKCPCSVLAFPPLVLPDARCWPIHPVFSISWHENLINIQLRCKMYTTYLVHLARVQDCCGCTRGYKAVKQNVLDVLNVDLTCMLVLLRL